MGGSLNSSLSKVILCEVSFIYQVFLWLRYCSVVFCDKRRIFMHFSFLSRVDFLSSLQRGLYLPEHWHILSQAWFYSQSTSRVTGLFEIWMEFWNLRVGFEYRQQDFRVPVEISLVYWRYKAMHFSLHYSITYFKNNYCLPSILNLFFFQLMRLFQKDF